MTPVPLELPLRPAEAADVANLIFDHAEGKPLSDEVRNRLAARAAVLKFQTLTPFFGSLERDPVHHSVYYLAVDSETEPLLLHMALAAAPTSSIYYKPLLIGRMRRPNGSEMVINAIPFGPARPSERGDVCRAHQFGLLSEAAGCTNHDHGGGRLPRGLRHVSRHSEAYRQEFRRLRRGLSRRDVRGHPRRLAIRLYGGDRSQAPARISSDGKASAATPSRFLPARTASKTPRRSYQQIRQARAALKISRGFDLELDCRRPL